MQFSCGQCGTRYSVPDEKVRGKRLRTRCRKCSAEIVIEGTGPEGAPESMGGARSGAAPGSVAKPAPATRAPAAAPAARAPAAALARAPAAAPAASPTAKTGAPQPAKAPAAPAPARAEERWTVALSRTEQRKMTTAEVVEGYAAGTISNETLVWKQGMSKWEPPFDVPAIALALGARGIERHPPPPARSAAPPRVAPAPVAPAPVAPMTPMAAAPMAVDPIAYGWDDENEATRVSEAAIPFMARRMLPDAPKNPVVPEPPKPPPRPAPVPARPPAKPPAPVPAPAAKLPPKPEPPRAPIAAAKIVSVSGPPARRAIGNEDDTQTVRDMPEIVAAAMQALDAKRAAAAPVPSSPVSSDFDFADESTAVIAPDRARELLDAEMAKSGSASTPPPPAEAAAPTPLAFGFDDESPKVIEPEKAEALLTAQESQTPHDQPGRLPGVAAVGPRPPAQSDSGKYPALDEHAPSVLVDGKQPEAKPKEAAVPKPKEPAPKPPPGPKKMEVAPNSRDIIHGFQNEPTRVVRVQKKGRNPWLVFVLALIAAAASGFVASEILSRHHPVHPKGP